MKKKIVLECGHHLNKKKAKKGKGGLYYCGVCYKYLNKREEKE